MKNRVKLFLLNLLSNWALLLVVAILITTVGLLNYHIQMDGYLLGILTGVLSSSIISVIGVLAKYYQEDEKQYARIKFLIEETLNDIGVLSEKSEIKYDLIPTKFTENDYKALLMIASNLRIPNFFENISYDYKEILDKIDCNREKMSGLLKTIKEHCNDLPAN